MLNFIFRIAILSIIFVSTLFAHKEPVHQHITREAFKLLLKSYPQLACSEMATFVGYSETNTNSKWQSWGDGKLVSGAWLEDHWDIVYHYGIGRAPSFNQWGNAEFVRLFEDERAAYSSITHFWDADRGLNAATDLSDIAYPVGIGTYWSFSCENAMQKMYKYLNGDFDNRWIYKTTTYWNCSPFCYLGSDQRMGNLFQLYRQTLQIYAVGYLDCFSGNWTNPYNQCPTVYYNIKYVYEQLGRMCHLLEDQSVPAHVHGNSHACTSGMYCDYYENSVPNWHLWTADEVYSAGGTFINPYNSWGDPLYYLMYLMNQATDHYASGRSDGDDNYDQSCPGLSQIYSTLGSVPVTQSQINDQNCRAMHDKLFPLVIRATAGLLYWFAMETGQIRPPLSVSISGPSVGPCATATWTANVTGGNPPYSFVWYQMWSSGGGEAIASTTKSGTIGPDRPIDEWWQIGTGNPLQWYWCGGNGYLRVDVTDACGTLVSAQKFIAGADGGGGGGQAKMNDVNVEQQTSATQPPQTFSAGSYPNPFNPSVTIKYQLPIDGHVRLWVFDALGREIEMLVDEAKSSGFHSTTFDASRLPSGIYFARISMTSNEGKPFVQTIKLLLTK